MIKAKNLTKFFGSTLAVDNLSFQIKKGEIVGFLGPNGAGKTTTVRMLTGFLQPDKGQIEIDDAIGYLPENNPLYQEMLVSEILEFFADLKHLSAKKRKLALDFVITATKLNEVFYQPVAILSKGFRQRVGLAIALLNKPAILILDEPTEGLDPNQRMEIRLLIKKLANHRTIILCTHVMQEVKALCSRILILNNGKLVADGTAEELSALAKKERSLKLEIEGKNIKSCLQKVIKDQSLQMERVGNNRFKIKLISRKNQKLPLLISRLARQHDWIIWQLAEEEYQLEDIFRKLTRPPVGRAQR